MTRKMEYGFITGDHSSDEGGHTGDNILACGGQRGRSTGTRGTAISVGENIHGGRWVS
jgi:hypothetical protein